MTANRITKMLMRHLVVSSRDQLNRYDIEAQLANIERVGLVIRVRWTLVAALAVYSVLGMWAYTLEMPLFEILKNLMVPALAMVFVVGYNTFYHLTYRKLGNIAILNHAQLMFDALVVAVLVHYSGGAHSWFWAMYPLFVLEAAFILPRRFHAWAIAAFCLFVQGVVLWGEYFGLLTHVKVPFVSGELYRNFTYVFVRFLWQTTVLAGVANVGTMMTETVRRREETLAASSITDEKTGLYERGYLNRALASELHRAQRDGRMVAVLLIDIDDLAAFNEVFGFERGDRVLQAVAGAMGEVVAGCAEGTPGEGSLLARYGGEEFVAVLHEECAGDSPLPEFATATAEAVRAAAERARVGDAGVTVSVGVVFGPHHGTTPDELLTVADGALQDALSRGGNSVHVVGLEG